MSKAEKFIQEHTNNCFNYNSYEQDPTPWLTPDEARKAVEIEREEMIEWLQKNAYKYSNIGLYTEAMITDLKQAMKDE